MLRFLLPISRIDTLNFEARFLCVSIYICIPRTQMTLVLIGKGPDFRGLTFKHRGQLGLGVSFVKFVRNSRAKNGHFTYLEHPFMFSSTCMLSTFLLGQFQLPRGSVQKHILYRWAFWFSLCFSTFSTGVLFSATKWAPYLL